MLSKIGKDRGQMSINCALEAGLDMIGRKIIDFYIK
jgi:hypothetical protein